MDNNNKYSYDASVNASVSRRRRRRSTLRAQKRAIIVIGALTVLLAITLGIVSYFVGRIVYTDEVDGARYYVKEKNGEFVLCDSDGYTLPVTPDGYFSTEAGTLVDVDEKSGACKTVAIVDTDDAEEIYTASNGRFQMFQYIKNDDIQELTICNDSGQFEFYRNKDNKIQIRGYEDFPVSNALFECVAGNCGYSLTRYKVSKPIKDANGGYAEYGLTEQTRVDEDGNEYLHKPMWYRITDSKGKMYTVYVGDAAPDGSGYYAKYAERDSVYIMNYELNENDTGLVGYYEPTFEKIDTEDNLIACPIERYISPSITVPLDMYSYAQVENFAIFEGEALKDGMDSDTDNAMPLVSFSYWDMADRQGTLYSSYAYKLHYPKGYNVSDAAVKTALSSIYNMKFLRVVDLKYAEKDDDKYGFSNPEYLICFEYGDVEHYVFVSKLTEAGTYYIISSMYDMVLEVSRGELLFLEYSLVDWITEEYFDYNIAWMNKITLETPDDVFTFVLDNSESDSVTNPTCSESAKKENTISSDKLKVYAYDSKGNKMSSITSYTVTDKNGYVWTIDEDTISVKDANGKAVEIINDGYLDKNAIGNGVVVLLGQIEGKDGTLVSVGANTLTIVEPSGKSNVYLRYGTEIFRRFYISILHATIEGSVREGDFALTEEQIAEILANPDEGYSVKLTVETSYKGVNLEYRFYPYSERRAMITINGADGEFYVLRSFTDKIAADALRVIKGEAVNSTSKY
jgi:hypothetical protein